MSNIYEQADDIMKLTSNYNVDRDRFFNVLINNDINDDDVNILIKIFDNYVEETYRQKLLYILSDGAVGYKDE